MNGSEIIMKSIKIKEYYYSKMNSILENVNHNPPRRLFFSYNPEFQYSKKKERIISKIETRFPGHILFDPVIVRQHMKKNNGSGLPGLARQFDTLVIWQEKKRIIKSSLDELKSCQLYDIDCYLLKYRKRKLSIIKIQIVNIKTKDNESLIIKKIKNIYRHIRSTVELDKFNRFRPN
jgi:hypothetical protein